MEPTVARLLQVASRQFAERGFAGASMRGIAAEAGVTQAAIYHHFPGKDALYIASVRALHEEKAAQFRRSLAIEAPPRKKLALMVEQLLLLLDEDPVFRHIYFRELIEGDEKRLHDLANLVFADMAELMEALLKELAPAGDSHLLMLSVAGLVLHHLEARRLSAALPAGRAEHRELSRLAEHITGLLLHGMEVV